MGNRKIENLVFKGGGVLGIAYAGAIKVLEEQNILQNIKGVAGTSAGSIVSTLLALKCSAAEIKQIVSSTDFKKFEDKWDPLRIPTKYGLYKGDYFLSWIKGIIKEKTGNENITYEGLKDGGFLDLRVFSTDLNSSKVAEFSVAETPDVIVAESIRASMSIPLFFQAWRFPNSNPNNHVYVDGGTVYNYPITAFPDFSTTLGFFLFDDNSDTSDLGYDHILGYVKSLFNTLMQSQNIEFEKNKQEQAISVKIDNLGISAIDFNLTPAMMEELYQSGLKATQQYLESNNLVANTETNSVLS